MNQDIYELKVSEFNKIYGTDITADDYKAACASVDDIAKLGQNDTTCLAIAETLGDVINSEPKYKGIVRNVLQTKTIDASEENKYYKKTPGTTAYFMADAGEIKKTSMTATKYTVDTWQLTSEDIVLPFSDVVKWGFDSIAEAKMEVATALDKKEDDYFIALLHAAAVSSTHQSNSAVASTYGVVDFITQWATLAVHSDSLPAHVIIHPVTLLQLLGWGSGTTNGILIPETRQAMLKSGNTGNPTFVKFHTTRRVSTSLVYMTLPSDELGWFFNVRQTEGRRRSAIVRLGQDQESGKPAYFIMGYEMLGMTISQDTAVHELTIT